MMKEYILKRVAKTAKLYVDYAGKRFVLVFADGDGASTPPRLYTTDTEKQLAIESSEFYRNGLIVPANSGGGGGGSEIDPTVPGWAKVEHPFATIAEVEKILYVDV